MKKQAHLNHTKPKQADKVSRKEFLNFSQKALFLAAVSAYMPKKMWAQNAPAALDPKLSQALNSEALQKTIGNFQYIYNNPQWREAFKPFLDVVFGLYPQEAFHQAIFKHSLKLQSDQEVYAALEKELPKLTGFFQQYSRSLRALKIQKKEMLRQTRTLLSPDSNKINNYLEIGTPGRYLASLKKAFGMQGDMFILHEEQPSFHPIDIVERGQFLRNANYIDLKDYQSQLESFIPKNSLDLVSVFIGFHHCPKALRLPFLSSIQDCLKTGGKLLVRDHDAHDETILRTVALAHDVFNVGTKQSWEYNHKERRNFYSLDFLKTMLADVGFKAISQPIYQTGDPTKNALILFEKV